MKCRSFDKIMKDYSEKCGLSKYSTENLPDEIKRYMQCLVGKELSCDCRFDHDIWEKADSFHLMRISFEQFVVMADLLGQFERENPCEYPNPYPKEAIAQLKQ